MSGARPGRVRRASRLSLKREHVFGLAVQAGVPAVDDLEVARVLLFPPDLREVATERGLDDLRAVAGRAGEVINRLLAAYEAGRPPLVASEYEAGGERTRGVPALFSRALFPELMALRGAEGAKRVITRHSSRATFIAAPEAAFDVDTPEDYRLLKRDAADDPEAG